MLQFLKNLFTSDPKQKLLKERDRLYVKAVELQRNGDLRTYGAVMTRISELEKEYAWLCEKEDEE